MASTIILKNTKSGRASVLLNGSAEPDAQEFSSKVERLYPDARIFMLDCNFERAGVWGGVAELVESLWPEMLKDGKDLIERHDYELARVVPWLITEESQIRRTLTDAAPEVERVRSYAADRALRIPHGLIDLLLNLKVRSAHPALWIVCGYDYGRAGSMAQLFYSELHRRAAKDRGIEVVLGVPHGQAQQSVDEVRDGKALRILHILRAASPTALPSHEAQCNELEQLEQEAKLSTSNLIRRLPRLIQLSESCGSAKKAISLKLTALSHYCAEGLYQDALRYADGLLAESLGVLPADEQLHWTIAYKTLNACLGAGKIDEAFALATGSCQKLAAHAGPRMRSNLLYLQAMLYARFRQPRDLPRGEELLREAIEILDPEEMASAEYHFARVFLHNGLAMIRVFQKRHLEALALCQEGMQEMNQYLEPTEHLLHRSVLVYNVAQVYGTLGRTDQAIEYLSQAISMDPNYSEYFNERGNLYLSCNDYTGALKDYQAAIRLSPPYPEVLVNLAQCYRILEQYEVAIGLYDRALDLRPGTLLAKIGRGSCLQFVGRNTEALSEYSEVLSLDPSLWEIYANRAALYYDLDRFDEALDDLDEAIRLNPGQPQLMKNRELMFAAAQEIEG